MYRGQECAVICSNPDRREAQRKWQEVDLHAWIGSSRIERMSCLSRSHSVCCMIPDIDNPQSSLHSANSMPSNMQGSVHHPQTRRTGSATREAATSPLVIHEHDIIPTASTALMLACTICQVVTQQQAAVVGMQMLRRLRGAVMERRCCGSCSFVRAAARPP